jgi:hypothetical protein
MIRKLPLLKSPASGARGFLATSVIGVVFVVAAGAQTEDVLLSCEGNYGLTSYILLHPAQEQAELIDRDPAVIGSLTVEDNLYRMVFPRTDKTHEIHILVNRYSGKFEWEHEDPPDRVFRTGTCSASEAVRKF